MMSSDIKFSSALYFLLFLFGVAFLFLRNPDPIFNPIVYAEDGTWIALGLREGWGEALWSAREDYFVFLNILLLFISTCIATTVGNGTIENLPYAIAFVSFSFFSAFGILVFATLKSVSSTIFATLGFVLSLMIPLGISQNEIIGRIIQVGFFAPAIAAMLFFWRTQYQEDWKKYAIDIAIILSAGTNPVVFVLAFFYYLRVYFSARFSFVWVLKHNLFSIALLSILAIATFSRMKGSSAIPDNFVLSNLFEASISRSILYPLIFPWYRQFSDFSSLGFFLLFVLIVFIALRTSTNSEAKELTYSVITTTIIYLVLTFLMRRGLTGFLNHYQTTFPDRYFMGINVLVLLLVVLCIAQLVSNHKTRLLGVFLSVGIVLVYGLNYSQIFEWKASKLPLRGPFTFEEQICLSDVVANIAEIQIYPELPKWKMFIPKEYIEKKRCIFNSYEDLGVARPG
jgi:hypothetical protein